MRLHWVRTWTRVCENNSYFRSNHVPGGVHPDVLDALAPAPGNLSPLDVLAVHAEVPDGADHADLLVRPGEGSALKHTIKSHAVLPAWQQIREVIRNLVFTF